MLGSDVKLIGLLEEFLENGNVTCMSGLHITYMNVCSSNGVDTSVCKVNERTECLFSVLFIAKIMEDVQHYCLL